MTDFCATCFTLQHREMLDRRGPHPADNCRFVVDQLREAGFAPYADRVQELINLCEQLEGRKVKSWEHDQTAAALNALAKDIFDWAVAKGFWEVPREMKRDPSAQGVLLQKSTKIMLVVTELAELVEGLRKPVLATIAHPEGAGPAYTNEEEEVADAIIRLLDYAGAYGLRIGEALCAKMAKNEGRPYRHGKEF